MRDYLVRRYGLSVEDWTATRLAASIGFRYPGGVEQFLADHKEQGRG